MYFTVGYSWVTGLVAFIFVLDFFVLEIVFVFLPEMVSAVKIVAAWRQCREESYRKVRKVIEHVHIPSSFLLMTFPTFPQKVLLSFVLQHFES